jgi:DNA repair protein RadC
LEGRAGLVLAHDHPSGDARPSESSCRVTRRLVAAAEALDCT